MRVRPPGPYFFGEQGPSVGSRLGLPGSQAPRTQEVLPRHALRWPDLCRGHRMGTPQPQMACCQLSHVAPLPSFPCSTQLRSCNRVACAAEKANLRHCVCMCAYACELSILRTMGGMRGSVEVSLSISAPAPWLSSCAFTAREQSRRMLAD